MRRNLFILVASAALFIQCKSDTGQAAEGRLQAAPAESSVAGVLQVGKKVTITTSDNVVIVGSLYASTVKSAAVLCLHQWRSDRSHFEALAASLLKQGYTVLTIDMRGHGESVKKKDGSAVAPDRNAMQDVRAAIAFLKGQESVDASRIAIVGASYGSSNAIMYAAGDPAVKAVALLSPGLNFFNVLPIEPAVSQYARGAMLAVASAEDLRSVEAIDKIKGIAKSDLTTKIYDNAGHGTDILEANVGLQDIIAQFLKKNL
jgi:dienelactone hydrolase